jgi:DedD protein
MTDVGRRPEPGPREAPEDAGLRRQLLMRASVAASLIVLLLAGLAIYDRMVATPPSAPLVQAPPAAPAASPAEAPPAEALPGGDAPSEPELAAAPELAPPGQRKADDAPEPSRGAPRLVLQGEVQPPPAPSQPSDADRAPEPQDRAAPAEAPHPLEPAPAQTGKGYLLQVGVFTSLDNAEALRARLEGLGIPARMESRVVMGPFPNQAAARAAQARLREAGQSPGLIVSPPRR